MKKGLLILICLSLILPFATILAEAPDDVDTYSWKYRRTVTVKENAGIGRLSHPVIISLSMEDMNQDASDIRVTNSDGELIPYQITSKDPSKKLIKIRIGVDLPKNGTAKYYVYYGNPSADPPLQTHVGVEKYLGEIFITKAWGKVVISSYSADNKITIEDGQGNFLRDARTGQMVSPEVYGPGSTRMFTLKEPETLRIVSTGTCTVAVGNFGRDSDSTAFIPNTSYSYALVPKYLAITSLHDENTVRIFARGNPVENVVLSAGETLYLEDEVSQAYCQIETDKSCVVQYGGNPDKSLFAVPQKGLKYSFMPIGLVCISSAFDGTKVDITWSNGNKQSETMILNAGQKSMFTNPVLSTGKIRKATTITSSRPITVLAIGNKSHGHGATFLPSITGFNMGDRWHSITGTANKSSEQRDVWLIQPYSQGMIKEPGGLFEEITGEANRSTGAKTNGSQASVECFVSEPMMLLDGDPTDTSALFQVPTSREEGVSRIISITPETIEGGWMVEGDHPVPAETANESGTDGDAVSGDDRESSGFSSFVKRIFVSVGNPGGDPIAFTIFLVLVTALLLLGAGLFFKFSGAGEEDEFLKTTFDEEPIQNKKQDHAGKEYSRTSPKQTAVLNRPKKPIEIVREPDELEPQPRSESISEPQSKPEHKQEESAPESKPQPQQLLQQKPSKPEQPKQAPKPVTKKEPEVGNFKAPRLRKPDLSRFMTDNSSKSQTSETAYKTEPTPEHEPTSQPKFESVSPPEQIEHIPEPKPKEAQEQKPEVKPIRELVPEIERLPEQVEKSKPDTINDTSDTVLIDKPAIERGVLFSEQPEEDEEEMAEQELSKPIPVTKRTKEKSTPLPPLRAKDAEINTLAKMEKPTGQPTSQQTELANRLNDGGLVADAGALVRLHHEGLVHLFDRIYVSHTASILLPEELFDSQVLDKVTIMGKDAKRANKFSDEYGIFPEASRALVVAEKTKAKYYLTSAKLPRRIGKLNIIHVGRFS